MHDYDAEHDAKDFDDFINGLNWVGIMIIVVATVCYLFL